ncbi:hypothetical protein PFISCL1PPCAC_19186, partial [Pristionchus fissidentatus]
LYHQPKMSQQSMTEIADRIKNMEELCLMDLPNEILTRIFSYLDVSSRLKFRVNKRIDELELNAKNHVDKLEIDILSGRRCRLTDIFCLDEWSCGTLTGKFIRIDRLVNGLNRLSLNASIRSVNIRFIRVNEDYGCCRIIDSILKFKINYLYINPFYHKDGRYELRDLHGPNLSTLLTIAENITHANIRLVWVSITAKELCRIRELMLKRECKMESFSILVDSGVDESFLKECFGVTLEDHLKHIRKRIYRSSNPMLELSSSIPTRWLDLRHFEGNFETYFDRTEDRMEGIIENMIRFALCSESDMNMKKTWGSIIKFDHEY